MNLERLKTNLVCFGVLSLICLSGYAQTERRVRKTGSVIFITPQNIYVRFKNTGGINEGDTLYAELHGVTEPVMTAKYLSSGSCAGPIIGKVFVRVGDHIIAIVASVPATQETESTTAGHEIDTSLASQEARDKPVTASEGIPKTVNPRLYGGITVNSYSNFSNYTNSSDIQRWNYSVNMNADNIGGSDFYFSNYMYYTYLGAEWKQVTSAPFSNLRVYDLALGYKSSGLNLWAGRHINTNVAGVGPVDGLQAEEKVGSFTAGEIVGSRPDFTNLGFSPGLFQFGGYICDTDTMSAGLMRNTIGMFQQFNEMRTDRRFIYFQHTSSPFSGFSFYASGELDIFSLDNGVPKNSLSLTNLYFTTQYAPINMISLDLSLSAQRNVIYYQTFGTTLDSLLESTDYLRNNARVEANFRPFPFTFIMVGTGYSFQQGDINPTRDAEITVTQSDIPLLRISASVSYNRIISNFLNGYQYGLTLSKFLTFNSSSIMIGFSRLDYGFGFGGSNLVQNQPNAQVTTRLFGNLYMNLYYQGTYSGPTSYGTFMGGLTQRF